MLPSPAAVPEFGLDPDLAKIIWLSVAGGLGLLALLLTLLLLPGRVGALLRWLDKHIPGDFSSLHRPASRTLILLLTGVILFAAGVSMAGLAEFDVDPILETLRQFGQNVGTWSGEHLVTIAIVVLATFFATRVVNSLVPRVLQELIMRRVEETADVGELQKRERTLQSAITNIINVTIVSVASFVAVSELGVNVAPLLAGAGVIGIAIALGAQSLVRDVLAGTFVIMEDQYRVGDVVNIAGIGGLVEDINLRRTVLRDLDFIVHVIPNGEVRVASNYTKEKSRVNMNIEVAYKEDLDHCIAVLNRVGKEMKEDPYWGEIMNEPIQVLRVDNFGESGIAIKVLGETKPIRQWDVSGEFRRRVKRTFDEEGIEIPFPHRTLYWGTGTETLVRQAEGDRLLQEGKEQRSPVPEAEGDEGPGSE